MPPPRQDVDSSKIYGDLLRFTANCFPSNLLSFRKYAFTIEEWTRNVALTRNQRKIAFTLAEVLITLGIIGIVAAMTMPALIANHKKTVVETRLAKFYSTINQAVTQAEVDYGDKAGWEIWEDSYEKDDNGNNILVPNKEYFNKYFAPYIIATKIEYEGGVIIVYFPDGSLATFRNVGIAFYPEAKDYSIVEEESNAEIRGNQKYSGTKTFAFYFNPSKNSSADYKYHYNKGVEPYKVHWDGTEEMLRNNSSIGCRQEVSNTRAYCTALIQMNGWKIPKDYPLRF